MEKNGVETHIIQIVDEPGQILALQILSSIPIFVPTEEVGELVVEIRRSSVKIAELLQEIGRGHGDGTRGASRLTLSGQAPTCEGWKPWWATKHR